MGKKGILKGKRLTAKKAQVAVFLLVAVVLLLLAMLFFMLKNETLSKEIPQATANVKIYDQLSLKKYVEGCIQNIIPPLATELAYKGGTFNQSNTIWWQREKYHTICFNDELSKGCVQKPLLREHMAAELATELEKGIVTCVSKDLLQTQGFIVEFGQPKASVTINRNQIGATLSYPITLEKASQLIKQDSFIGEVKHDLGEVYEVAINILNTEITQGQFNKDEFMKATNAKYYIEKHRPYPNLVYKVTTNDQNLLQFLFSIEGKETITRIGFETPITNAYGCCINPVDQLIYANTNPRSCQQNDLVYTQQCIPPPIQLSVPQTCPDGRCNNCPGGLQHGQSKCEYDSTQMSKSGSGGLAYVGSRHYKVSCIDGELYKEEAKDYREEICIENGDTAIIRVNRWQSCAICEDESCCEDKSQHDCSWSEWLTTEQKCHPTIPPGFKFWDDNGASVCAVATESLRCDGFSCPNKWVDDTFLLCAYQGDCGNYRNIADVKSKSGFFNTDPTDYPRDYVYLNDGFNKHPRNTDLKLPLYVDPYDPNQQSLEEPLNQVPILMAAAIDFLDDMSSLSISDFLNPFSPPDIEILDYAFCGIWAAPVEEQNCNICNEPGKVCSEYRCKSLGRNCVYTEDQGVGSCEEVRTNDNTPPTLSFNQASLREPYTSKPSTLVVLDEAIQGFEIEPAIPQSELLTFTVDTSEAAKCKLAYIPNISYNSLPSVWFGSGKFSDQHNISFRMPPSLEVPVQFYEILGIESLDDLVDIAENFDSEYESYKSRYSNLLSLYKSVTGYDIVSIMDPLVSVASILLQQYTKIFEKSLALAKIMLADLENDKYYFFVKCIDENGNENVEQLFIKFQIDPNLNDTRPPIILAEEFKLNVENLTEIKIYANELVECRIDIANRPYSNLRTKMDCPDSIYKISAKESGSYECSATINTSGLDKTYILCKDNPVFVQETTFTMNDTGMFNVSKAQSRYFNITSSNTLRTTSSLLQATHINTSGAFTLQVHIDEKLNCRFGNNKTMAYDEMTSPINCQLAPEDIQDVGIYQCTITVPSSPEGKISCREPNANIQNLMPEAHVVGFT